MLIETEKDVRVEKKQKFRLAIDSVTKLKPGL